MTTQDNSASATYFPPVSRDLIETLRRIFPDRASDLPLTLEALAMRQGEQRVIEKLVGEYERQERDAKEGMNHVLQAKGTRAR